MEASPGKIATTGGAGGADADKSLPDPTGAAKLTLLGLLGVGIVLSIILNAVGWTTRAFQPAQDATANFALFAGFYVAAQIIERLLEVVSPLLPPWHLPGDDEAAKVAHAKADRAAIALGIATLAGVGASCGFGLYFLAAVGIGVETTAAGTVSTIPHTVDAIVTGLTIGAGTKPLHDLISNIQNKNNPKTGTSVS
ncbi:MAG TPA: hypothetical protein VNS60_05280 [Solirubrobacterales bacterium]|nr:hypothetical protein [Solirubrobacterales bacterium]